MPRAALDRALEAPMRSPLLWRHVHVSHFLVMLCCALLTSSPLHAAGSDGVLDLTQATELAAASAPRLRAQQLREQAARDDSVRAGQLPDPEFTAGVQNLPASGPQAFSPGADAMTMQVIGVTQAFPSRAKRKARTGVADAEARLATADGIGLRLAAKR